ncbi:MAG TPA: PAS domain S-box protein [Caldilinea sp.]|nr:PAS domain S-box protein [Caldilinea sp.]
MDKDAREPSNDEIQRLLEEVRATRAVREAQEEELQRMREMLRESRTRYFDLYDLAPVGYVTLDSKDTILESNLAAATMLGGPRQALMRHPFPHYILADDRAIFVRHRTRLLETGEMQQFELRLARLHGDVFWARLDASLAFDEESKLPLCLLTIIDIDQAKEQAEAMALNTIIVNAANDAIFTTTGAPDFIITSWNPGAEAIYGWTAGEAIGQSARILQSEYPGRDSEQVRRAILSSGGYKGEVIQTTKSGRRIHVDSRMVARTDAQGEIAGWIGVNRDITERHQAEAALQQSRRNLVQAQRIGHLGSWEWNVPQSTIFWSDELYRIFGVPADFPLTYESIEATIHPDDRAHNNVKVQEALESGQPVDFQFRIVRPDGAIRHIEQHIIAEHDARGALVCLVGIMQDITERRQAETEREALRARLVESERLEMIGRLADGIARDFNNMVTVVIMRAELSLRLLAEGDPSYRHLIEINKAAQHSAGLVRQLLGYAGKQEIAPKTLNLNATIDGMLGLLRELLGEEIDLSFHGASNLWPVYIDPTQIEQVLVNLCINARNAISTTGRVIITTTNTETEHEVWATGFVITPGDYVLLSVTDDGCGMASDILEHIFEPFYTARPADQGSGLGLATVYGIVKQNLGDIQVYSEPGIGSTFNVYLPRFRADGLPRAGAIGALLAEGNGEAILLVEDKADLLHSTSEALHHLGYVVTPCNTPEEALQLVADGRTRFDLLMTDIVMPKMDGRELAARCLALQPAIKCLYVSGYPAQFISKRGLIDDEVYFLRKPFSLAALAAMVRDVLRS